MTSLLKVNYCGYIKSVPASRSRSVARIVAIITLRGLWAWRLVVSGTSTLKKELEVFEQHRSDWSQSHPGEYVVIQDNVILEGFFRSYAEAFKAGLRKFGVGRSFLVKQVWLTEPVYFVS